jgi:DNA-binding beta-propeller fold protein YncE
VIAGGGTDPESTNPLAVALNAPSGLWLAPDGTLYFTEAGGGRVRSLKNGVLKIVAGTTGATRTGDASTLAINQPGGVTVDSKGRIVFTEISSGTIKRLENGKVTIIAGNTPGFAGDGGPATAALLKKPTALAYKGEELYVTDSDNQRVRKIDAQGIITTVAGNGKDDWLHQTKMPALEVQMYSPSAIAISPDGIPYLADYNYNYVARLTLDGQWEMVAGALDILSGDTGDGGPANQAKLNRPLGLTFDAAGNLYIADGGNFRIRKIAKDGTISNFAGLKSFNDNLSKLMASSGKTTDGEAATQSPMIVPTAIAFDASGNLFVAEVGTQGLSSFGDLKSVPLDLLPKVSARIRKITPDGKVYLVAGAGTKLLPEVAGNNSLGLPIGLAFDKDGRLIVTDSGTNQLKLLPKEAL